MRGRAGLSLASMSESSALRCGACTIVSPNYLPYARTLAGSYRAHHPGQPFFVLIVAALNAAELFANEPFTAVLLSAIGVEDLRVQAMQYDLLELNTNVKPTFLKYLLRRYELDRLVYLDPDIFCYAPLEPVFTALESNDAVLTPHITAPIADHKHPNEQEMLYNGTYNLGFIAVRRTPAALRLLEWWERRCLDLGFSEGRTGLFVDQKWMNLAPGLFEHVRTLRHPGCNMAYWNLQERTLASSEGGYTVNGEPLCFFHFSGIVPSDPAMLSRHTDRFTLADRPDLHEIFADYKRTVLSNGNPTLDTLPYGFDQFSDGTAVTALSRRLYSKLRGGFAGEDPFDAAGGWLRFCRHERLVAGKVRPVKATWKEFSGADRRVGAVHWLLRRALRVLGPHRYELLMRYLAHIAVLRNQSVLFARKAGSGSREDSG